MSEVKTTVETLSPGRQLMQMMWPGIMTAQALHVVAQLGIADLVHSGPKTADDLSRATGTHGPSLLRVLRALSGVGVFSEDAAGQFHNTELSEMLRADHAESVRAWPMMLGAAFIWKPCGDLLDTVKTGQTAFDAIFHSRFYDHLAAHRDDAAVFDAAMSAGSAMFVPAILESYDFSRFGKIVDLGGGQGQLLHRILAVTPQARGVLYDFPAVIAGTPRDVDRCEVQGGNMFEAVPEGGDAYILKNVIHGFDDDDSLKILANCRRSMRPQATLLLMERVLQPSNEPDPGGFMDLLMMVLARGKERTEPEFRALFGRAGFALTRVVPTATPTSILECHLT